MLEDTSEPQSHYKCFLTCSKNPGEALFLHHIRLVERKIWELVLRWSPREVMASPPWFSEETLRRPSIVTAVVVVKTTVEEGVCVESPLLSILHGPAGLLSDFAPRHSWLLPWGGQIHVKRSHRIPAPHLLCDTLLCPLAEAEAFLQAAPRVPSGSKWRTQRTKLICKFLQRKSTA